MTKIELKPYPNNPREISQDAFEKLGESMQAIAEHIKQTFFDKINN